MTRDAGGTAVDTDLAEIACAHGVAVSYLDGARREQHVDADVVVDVLGLLGVDASTPARATRRARRRTRTGPALPATIGMRSDRARAVPASGVLTAEDGTRRDVDGELPAGLEPGRYALETGDRRATVVVAPPSLPRAAPDVGLDAAALRAALGALVGHRRPRRPARLRPPDRPRARRRARCCSTRCTRSRRCRRCSRRRTRRRAGGSATRWRCASPTSPPTRRADAGDPRRGRRAAPGAGRRPDRPRPGVGGQAVRAGAAVARRRAGRSRAIRSPGLDEFATFCALAERHGGRWQQLAGGAAPPGRRTPSPRRASSSPRGSRSTPGCSSRSAPSWPTCGEAAREAGMPVGVMHDLAVGCDPEGADGWALQDVLAAGRAVGAPPDAFNQRGQDWGLPPWRPDRLAETGYAALPGHAPRAARGTPTGCGSTTSPGCGGCGGCRRAGRRTAGTYVHYDAEAMLAMLLLEAHRAGALVIGEDLGTVLPEVTEDAGPLEHARLGRAVVHPRPRPGDRRRRRPVAAAVALAGALGRDDLDPRPADRARLPARRARPGPAPSWGCSTTRSRNGRKAAAERAELVALLVEQGPAGLGGRRGGRDRRRDARAARAAAVPAGARVALRRARRDPPAEPAGHRRRVPELAAAAAGRRWSEAMADRGWPGSPR